MLGSADPRPSICGWVVHVQTDACNISNDRLQKRQPPPRSSQTRGDPARHLRSGSNDCPHISKAERGARVPRTADDQNHLPTQECPHCLALERMGKTCRSGQVQQMWAKKVTFATRTLSKCEPRLVPSGQLLQQAGHLQVEVCPNFCSVGSGYRMDSCQGQAVLQGCRGGELAP